MIEHVELFHDSLAAALDWSTRDPAVGLRLLRRLARSWQGSGRPHAALAAVDRLLTDENAERFPLLGPRPPRRWRSSSGPLVAGRAAGLARARAGARRGSRRRVPGRRERLPARLHGGQQCAPAGARPRAWATIRRVHRHHGAGRGRRRSARGGAGLARRTRTSWPPLVRAATYGTSLIARRAWPPSHLGDLHGPRGRPAAQRPARRR